MLWSPAAPAALTEPPPAAQRGAPGSGSEHPLLLGLPLEEPPGLLSRPEPGGIITASELGRAFGSGEHACSGGAGAETPLF